MRLSIQLLKDELNKYKKAKEKSISSYKQGILDEETHKEHINNLNPKILELEEDLKILILNNVAGSGTTSIAARNTNRGFILIEKEKKECNIIRKRLNLD